MHSGSIRAGVGSWKSGEKLFCLTEFFGSVLIIAFTDIFGGCHDVDFGQLDFGQLKVRVCFEELFQSCGGFSAKSTGIVYPVQCFGKSGGFECVTCKVRLHEDVFRQCPLNPLHILDRALKMLKRFCGIGGLYHATIDDVHDGIEALVFYILI